MLATLDAPHMLILDEPTNHLDIESREALVEALTAYTGAVILVSHDMHLLSLVADRLWLVKGGRVTPYDGDLESYREMLLAADRPAGSAPKPGKSRTRRPTREAVQALRQEVRKCEQRVEKLSEMRDTLAGQLADPALYDPERADEAQVWQRKYAEVMDGLDRAESLWMAALEKLEKAEADRAQASAGRLRHCTRPSHPTIAATASAATCPAGAVIQSPAAISPSVAATQPRSPAQKNRTSWRRGCRPARTESINNTPLTTSPAPRTCTRSAGALPSTPATAAGKYHEQGPETEARGRVEAKNRCKGHAIPPLLLSTQWT